MTLLSPPPDSARALTAAVPDRATAPPTTYSAAPSRAPQTEEGVPWERYLDVLRRHLFLVLAMIAAGSAVGVLASKRVAALYEAQVTVWINENGGQHAGPIRAQQLLPSTSWVELLRSFAIVDPVVRRLDLNLSYKRAADSVLFRDFETTALVRPGAYELRVGQSGRDYVLTTRDDVVVERGTVGDSIGRSIGLAWLPDRQLIPAGRPIAFSVTTARSASVELLGRLQSMLPEHGQFLTMRLSGTDPRRTARTANALAEQFVRSSTDLKKHHLVEFRKTLGDQLALSERELHRAESQLEQFRVNTITLPSGGSPISGGVQETRDPLFANYFQQKALAEDARVDRAALERLISEAKGGPLNTQAFLLVPSILNNTPQLRAAIEELSTRQASLRTERQYLTDANPRIKQLADAVHVLQYETIPRIAGAVLASLRTRENDLDARITAQSAQLRAIPARTIEEQRLLRQVAATENLYNSLKARYEEVSLSEAEITPDLSVLDSAQTPMYPSANDAPRLVLLAVLASIVAAIAIALLHDRFDRRFRYPEQATNDLGLHITGTIPRLHASRRGSFGVETLSQTVESFRTIRLGLRYDFPAEPVVLSVSSPGPGDGKSLVSSNLALAFASAGHRTLLVDGDVRCGKLHGTFNVPVAPGLVDYLQNGAVENDVIRATATPNLYLLPCGKRRSRAPELLVSERMPQLIAAMRQTFDVVIIDCPPFVAGIDAYAIGAATGNMLVVLRHGVTDRKLAAAKLEVVDRLPIRLLGVVLNGVVNRGMYRYYGNDYSYGDKPGHGSLGDVATPKGLVLRA